MLGRFGRRIVITLLVVLVSDLIVGRSSSLWVPYAIAGSSWFAHCPTFQWDVTNPVSFLGGFNGDALSVVFTIIALSAAVILMSIRYIEWHGFSRIHHDFAYCDAGGCSYRGQNEW